MQNKPSLPTPTLAEKIRAITIRSRLCLGCCTGEAGQRGGTGPCLVLGMHVAKVAPAVHQHHARLAHAGADGVKAALGEAALVHDLRVWAMLVPV